MVAPINYGIQIPDPTQAFTSAFNLGAGIQEAEAKQQQAQRQLQMEQQVAAARQRVMSPDATSQDYFNLAMMLPENMSKPVREVFALRSAEQNQKSLREGGQVLSALVAGKPEMALSQIDIKLEAARNAGNQEAVRFLTMNRQLVENNPESAKLFFISELSQIPGGDKVVESALKQREDVRKGELQAPAVRRAEADATQAERQVQELDIKLRTLEQVKAAELLKAQSEAQKAEVEAKFAERLKNLEIEKGKAQAARDRAAAAASMATASQGPAPTVTTVQDPSDPTRTLTIDARRYQGGTLGAAGVIGVGGKTAASAQKEVQAEQGRTLVADIIDSLKSNYTTLDKARAIPSTQRGVLSNVLTAVEVSGPGQFVSRAVGSEPQAVRDVIQSSRLQLLNAIKQATGLSSQQLNSNVELQTWLKSVSDPSQQIESVIPILENIEKFVAGGGKRSERAAATPVPGQPAPAATSAPIYAVNPQTNQRIMSTDGGNTWNPVR